MAVPDPAVERDRTPVREIAVGTRVSVEVPATSANLGPGFDCFGLALDWRDRCLVEVIDQGWHAEVSGEGAGEVPADERHLVLSSARRALDRLGWRVPGLALTAHNTIPHGRGLGSSSAAIVAGLLAAAGLAAAAVDHAVRPEPIEPGDWLSLATEIEGHPDNVAAALYGGFVLAFEPVPAPGAESVKVRAVPAEVHPDTRAVVFVPSERLSTERARGLLPGSVPHREAAADAGRAGLLVHALARDPSLLFQATADWLHQGYRGAAMPASTKLMESLRSKGFAAVISGAGPTVLVLGDEAQTASAQRWAEAELGVGTGSGFRSVELAVAGGGRLV